MTTSSTPSRIEVEEVTFLGTNTSPLNRTVQLTEARYVGDGNDDLAYRASADDWIDSDPRNNNAGRLQFVAGVDGMMDMVVLDSGATNNLKLVKLARDQFDRLYDELVAMHAEGSDPGRCMSYGNWGRCGARHDDGEHDYPTEEDFRAELASWVTRSA